MIFFTYKLFKLVFVIEETWEILKYLTFSVRSTDFSPLLYCKGMDNGVCGVLTLISRGLDKVMVLACGSQLEIGDSIKDKGSILLAFDFPTNVSSLLKYTHFFLLQLVYGLSTAGSRLSSRGTWTCSRIGTRWHLNVPSNQSWSMAQRFNLKTWVILGSK